jgi:hypothetical protein
MHIHFVGVMMGISQSLRALFEHMYMAISIEDDIAKISYSIYKAGTRLTTQKKEFEITSSEELDPYIVRYVHALQKKYRHNYVALVSNAKHQGLLPRCNDSAFLNIGIKKSDIKYRCIDDRWGSYISKESFLSELEFLDEIVLDLFFSPFSILSSYIDQNRLVDQTTIYILHRVDSLSVMITKNNTHLYGTHFSMDSTSDTISDGLFNEPQMMDEEDAEDFSMDDFGFDDSLDDLEDLDSFTASDEMSIDSGDAHKGASSSDTLEIFGRDLKVYTYIKSAIDEFYHSGSHDFIDGIVIYDTHDINSAIIDFIENELFLPVSIKNVDILKTAIEFSKREVEF